MRALKLNEHKEALRNLAKQEAADAKKIAKQLSKWKKEERASEPKQMSKSLQWFLNEIQAKGIFEVSDFDKSKVYLQKLVREARKLGYQIEPVRKSIAIVRYRLIDTQ